MTVEESNIYIQGNLSKLDRVKFLNREVSSFQGLLSTQMMYLGLRKVSCLWRCPQFRGVPLYILNQSAVEWTICIYMPVHG